MSEQPHTVEDGDGVCGDCSLCNANVDDVCETTAQSRCAWCGHCTRRHLHRLGAPPEAAAFREAISGLLQQRGASAIEAYADAAVLTSDPEALGSFYRELRGLGYPSMRQGD